MPSKNLTNAKIQKNRKKSEINLKISLNEIENLDYPYFLIIQSTAASCTRLTLYPVNNDKILKLIISGSEVSDKGVEALSNILRNFEIIHTSGLLIKKQQLNYECYLNLTFSDTKYKDLKTSLNNIKNVFNEVIIEEISLKKTRAEKL